METSELDSLRKLVQDMRGKNDHLHRCEAENDTLNKCILCKAYLSSNQWSFMLEKHVKTIFDIGRKKDNVSGDGISMKRSKKIEIKVSLGDVNGQMNFVQLRPDHKIDFYVLLAYNLFEGELGGIYWFICDPASLYSLLSEYGGYAHGTIEKLGPITSDNIYGRNCEYVLRPNPTARDGTKSKRLWNILVNMFQTNIDCIQDML